MSDSLHTDLSRLMARLETELGSSLVTVCLFGSQVESDRPDRDIDLLVVRSDAPEKRWDRGDLIRTAAASVSSRLRDWLSAIVLTPAEAEDFRPFYLGMLDRHELLVDRDGFFAGVLERMRERLDELGARRLVDPDGYEYWDLVPDWQPGDEVIL